MRISKLSERADLPVGTVKFYLRTGLLHPGRATSATQAQYDDSHLRRLRLVRALLEVGGLPLADIQRVLEAVEVAGADDVDDLASVQATLAARVEEDVDLTEAERLMTGLGWRVDRDAPAMPQLARALSALETLDVRIPPDRMRGYADAALAASFCDQAAIEEADPEHRPVVVASAVIVDALVTALRRLAAEHLVGRHPDVPAPRRGDAEDLASHRH